MNAQHIIAASSRRKHWVEQWSTIVGNCTSHWQTTHGQSTHILLRYNFPHIAETRGTVTTNCLCYLCCSYDSVAVEQFTSMWTIHELTVNEFVCQCDLQLPHIVHTLQSQHCSVCLSVHYTVLSPTYWPIYEICKFFLVSKRWVWIPVVCCHWWRT